MKHIFLPVLSTNQSPTAKRWVESRLLSDRHCRRRRTEKAIPRKLRIKFAILFLFSENGKSYKKNATTKWNIETQLWNELSYNKFSYNKLS